MRSWIWATIISWALAACGCTTTTWEKPRGTQQDWSRDEAACEVETQKAGPWSNPWQEGAFHDRCLKAKGWSHAS